MTPTRLDGQRVLLTQADQFMGPALARTFEAQGATVIADTRALHSDPAAAAAAVQAAGHVDVLLLHLSLPAPNTAAEQITDDEWRSVFAHLVDPMPRLVAAVLPQMRERGRGRKVRKQARHVRRRGRGGPASAGRSHSHLPPSRPHWGWEVSP